MTDKPQGRRSSASPSAPPRDPAAIQLRAMRDLLRWLGSASEGARVWEAPGVSAAIVPATPGRSIINSVVYEDAESLAAEYERVAAAYDDAGIAAWTVWTPDYDQATIELLRERGHAFDGQPGAMTSELTGFQRDDRDIEWDDEGTFEELGRLNDEAYGYAPGDGYAAALGAPSADLPMRVYRARDAGETACVLAAIDHEDDLGIYFVATPERHRGKQLASRLLGKALSEGGDRGLRTSSLQASAKGASIYERLGYRRDFRFHLHERRR